MINIKYFLALIAIAFGLSTVKAVSFTLTVDDASHVSVYTEVWDSPSQAMIPDHYYEAENNVFKISLDEFKSVKIKGIYPWNVSSFTFDNGSPAEPAPYASTPNIWSLSVQSLLNNKNINITTVNEDLDRAKKMTLKVDDASAVYVTLGNGENLDSFKEKFMPELNNGENSLKFNPDSENKLYVAPKEWGETLYSVTINGEQVSSLSMYEQYFMELSDNCTVEILTKAPDRDVVVSFNYSEGSEGCIGKITVDGIETEYADKITVKDGSVIKLYESDAFQITNWCINWGSILDWTGSSNEVSIVGDTELYFVAVPRNEINFTVKIDNPEGLSLYNLSKVIDLSAGENNLKLYEGNSAVHWITAPGYILESLYLTRKNCQPELFTRQSLDIENGMVLDFSVREINRNNTAIIWCEGVEIGDFECSVKNRFLEVISPLKDGYNVINFDEAENPLYIDSSYHNAEPAVNIFYLDSVAQQTVYPCFPIWEMNFSDMSVGKLFLTHRPSEYKITFDVDMPQEVKVTRDVIVPVVDFSNPIKCLDGTVFKIETTAEIEVTIGDMELDPEEDGSYLIEASDNYTIKIVTKVPTGVVTVGNENSKGIVYNISGVSLGRIDDLNTLPAGFYIVDGKKVLVE